MKSGRIFWALFFIAIGVLALLDNALSLSWDWSALLSWWPAVLILLGLAIMLKTSRFRWIVIGCAGFLVGIVAFAFLNRGCDVIDTDWNTDAPTVKQTLFEKYDSAYDRAAFFLDAGAGRFRILDSAVELIAAEARSSIGGYRLAIQRADSRNTGTLSMDGRKVNFRGTADNSVDIRLNTRPVWDLNLDIGAAKADFDLSRYRIRDLELDAGAASVTLKLGSRNPETQVRIGTGASSIKLRIPESADCEIRSETGLSSTVFTGFDKSSDDVYVSKGSGEVTSKIRIDIEAGVSSIRVERY